MDRELNLEIRRRAEDRCEYCHLPQSCVEFTHPIDHIVARQHHGPTVADNLALSCVRCNRKKGPNLSGIDPQTGDVLLLFNPRRQQWRDHFRWHGLILVGTTETGRATIDVLGLNLSDRILVREAFSNSGEFPRDFE
jgi:hypothetical protein